MQRLARPTLAPWGCCSGPLLARRLLALEILVIHTVLALIGLFARMYVVFPVVL